MVLRYRGHDYPEAMWTASHAGGVALALGRDEWVTPDRGPMALCAWLAVLHVSRTGENMETTVAAIARMPLAELAEAIRVEADPEPEE